MCCELLKLVIRNESVLEKDSHLIGLPIVNIKDAMPGSVYELCKVLGLDGPESLYLYLKAKAI
jgi:hypothetical protein